MAKLLGAAALALGVVDAHALSHVRFINLIPNTNATVKAGPITSTLPFGSHSPSYVEIPAGNQTFVSGNVNVTAELQDEKYYSVVTSPAGPKTFITVVADPMRAPTEPDTRNDYNMWDTPDYGFRSAKVQVVNVAPILNITVSNLNQLCHKCSPEEKGFAISANVVDAPLTVTVLTSYPNKFELTETPSKGANSAKAVTTDWYDFKEKRQYSMYIYETADGKLSYEIILDLDQPNEIIPIAIWFGILVGASVGWYWLVKPFLWRRLARPCYRKYRDWLEEGGAKEREDSAATASGEVYTKKTVENLNATANTMETGAVNVDTAGVPPNPIGDVKPISTGKLKTRLRSLDSFRGFDLMLMIFVNANGGGYWFFDHSAWDGLLVADLVFPWFMFMMGVSMALSLNKQGLGKPAANKRKMVAGIAWRSFKIWLWGQFLTDANFNNLPNYRVPGVLQRFAFANFFCGITMVLTHGLQARFASNEPESEEEGESMQSRVNIFHDIKNNFVQFLFAFCYMALYLVLTYAVKVPGCPTGYTGPGGRHEMGAHADCTGGAAKYIDKTLFLENHLYRLPTCKDIYGTGRYDPEGLLGSISSIFSVYLGYHAGRMIVNYKNHWKRVSLWLIYGAIFSLIGGGLAGFRQFDGPIPLNKNLWSFSYVLLMGGTAGIMLALFYVVIDIFKLWSGTPFVYPGMNSIATYSIGQIFQFYFPFSFAIWNNYDTTFNAHMMMLGNNLMNCWVVLIITTVWYHKRWFYTM